jgi:hypothetical protein
MGSSIHARRRGDGWRYRVYSSIVDAYLTPALTAAELRDHLGDDYSLRDLRDGHLERDVAPRLERAHRAGTSMVGAAAVDLDGPWEPERCDPCGVFHVDGAACPHAA